MLPPAGTKGWRRPYTRWNERRPNRCPVAPETRKLKRNLRHLLYGKKPHVYRVIYEIEEQRQTVWVLTIRHGARRKVWPLDLE